MLITSGEGTLDKLGRDSGLVFVFGKGMSECVRLSADEYCGRVRVSGKDEGSRAAMAVSEHGNGVVPTWDKNGYNLATLK